MSRTNTFQCLPPTNMMSAARSHVLDSWSFRLRRGRSDLLPELWPMSSTLVQSYNKLPSTARVMASSKSDECGPVQGHNGATPQVVRRHRTCLNSSDLIGLRLRTYLIGDGRSVLLHVITLQHQRFSVTLGTSGPARTPPKPPGNPSWFLQNASKEAKSVSDLSKSSESCYFARRALAGARS